MMVTTCAWFVFVQADEGLAELEQEVEKLTAEVERLKKTVELSDVLVKDMQSQIDNFIQGKDDLEVLRMAPSYTQCTHACSCRSALGLLHIVRQTARCASVELLCGHFPCCSKWQGLVSLQADRR